MLQLLLQYIAPGMNTIMLLILIQANAFKQVLKNVESNHFSSTIQGFRPTEATTEASSASFFENATVIPSLLYKGIQNSL